MFQPGQVIGGDYEVLDLLGQGGMGAVYKARQRSLDRIVCLKVPRPEMLADKEAMDRFEKEAKTVARINHPNIVSIFVVHLPENDSDTPYIVMEFVQGKELEKYLRDKHNQLKVRDFLNILVQICEGLHAAHSAQIIHRDIKPANIMVSTVTDTVKVMDFGIARITSSAETALQTMVVGTPAFMSPEQVRGERPSPASDIYALGGVLYVLLAQRPLFEGAATTVAVKQLTEMPTPAREYNPLISAELDAVILKCIEKDPKRRYPTCKDLAEDLEKVLRPQADKPLYELIPLSGSDGKPISTGIMTGATIVSPQTRKRSKGVLYGGIAASIALFVLFYLAVPASEGRLLAQAESLRAGSDLRAAVDAYRGVLDNHLPGWLGFADRDRQALEGLAQLADKLDAAGKWNTLDRCWNKWIEKCNTGDVYATDLNAFDEATEARKEWERLAPGDSELRAYAQALDAAIASANLMVRLKNEQAVRDFTAARHRSAAFAAQLPPDSPYLKTVAAVIARNASEAEKARIAALATPSPLPTTPPPVVTPSTTTVIVAPTAPPVPTAVLATPAPTPDRATATAAIKDLEAAMIAGPTDPFFETRFADPALGKRWSAMLEKILAPDYVFVRLEWLSQTPQFDGAQANATGTMTFWRRRSSNASESKVGPFKSLKFTLLWKENVWLIQDTNFPFEDFEK